MIEHINQTRFKHIVTIEDPIEFVYRDKCSIIEQREYRLRHASFEGALRRVLRETRT